MKVLEDTKNKTEDENFWKTAFVILLLCSPLFYIVGKFAFDEKEELQNKTQITSDAQAIRTKDTSIRRSSLLQDFEWYRKILKVVETKEARLNAIEERVSKLSLEIKELQKQKSEKNEN